MKFEIAVCREIKPDFFSRLIMWVTKRHYSHAFVIQTAGGEEAVYDCTEKGITVRPMAEFMDGNTEIVERVEVRPNGSEPGSPDFQLGRACGWLECSIGTADYSLVQAAGVALPLFNSMFIDSKRQRICSSYVAAFMRDALKLRHPRLGPDVRACRPGDVIEIAKEMFR